jgi:hypothetical protein
LSKHYVPKGFKFSECYKKARDSLKTDKYNQVHGLNKPKKESDKENNANEEEDEEEEETEQLIEVEDV